VRLTRADAAATREAGSAAGDPRREAPVAGGETSQTLDRGLRVLEVLAATPRGLTVSELAAQIGVNRTVVYRLVSTLLQRGLVRRDVAGRLYVGLGLLSLARGLEPVLRDLAQPVLSVEMAQHLHDIRRHMNAGADPLERASLFVKSNLEALALQQGGCSGASKSGPDDGNSGLARHVRSYS